MNRMSAWLVPLLLAGCGSGGEESGGEKADPVAQVRTAAVTTGATADSVAVYGVAEPGPGGERTLIAPSEAVIDRILAPNGTAVVAGQTVATLAPSRTTAVDIAKASADAASAGAAFARAQRLRTDGLASDADVETARAAARTARATVANLGMRRGGLVLRAPVAGVVQGLTARSGDQVAAGAAVASVASRGHLRARFGIDPAAARRVRPGQALDLSVVAGGGGVVSRVTGIDAQVDPTTRLAAVYAPVPADLDVGPGEALRGSIALTAQAQGLTIPYAALLDDGGRSYVFVVAGGVAHEREVSPGSSAGDDIRVLKGVRAGERVVVEGGTALEDGMKVVEQGARR